MTVLRFCCAVLTAAEAPLRPDRQSLFHAHMSDPKEMLEAKCAELERCRPLLEELEKCSARVAARGDKNTETCVQELFELTPCIDNCVHFEAVRSLHDCVGGEASVQATQIINRVVQLRRLSTVSWTGHCLSVFFILYSLFFIHYSLFFVLF